MGPVPVIAVAPGIHGRLGVPDRLEGAGLGQQLLLIPTPASARAPPPSTTKEQAEPGQRAAVSPRSNDRRHNLCISGIEKLALAGDAYANCPNGWT
jgi:hypothetical protein